MAAKKLSKKTIKKQLIASEESSLPDRFVSAAVYIDESGYLYHAGITVGSEAGKVLFHFNAPNLEEVGIGHYANFYQREFKTIPDYLADAFYVHCSEAIKNSAPEYGKFYSGAYFKDGEIVSPEEAPYRMSCVGFCLAILQGWNTEDIFIDYDDWTAENSLSDDAIEKELSELKRIYHYLDENDLAYNIRRIKPNEYLASAYLDVLPVTKELVTPIAVILKQVALEINESKKNSEVQESTAQQTDENTPLVA